MTAWISFPLFLSQESLEGLAGERQETLEENLSEIFRRKGGKHVKYVSLKWAELSQTKRILCGRVHLFLCFFGL